MGASAPTYNQEVSMYYGVSRGETGDYGIGDLVTGDSFEDRDGELLIDGEPVYNIFTADNLNYIY